MAMIDADVIRDTLGPNFANNFAYLPAQGTRGGDVLEVHEGFYKLSNAVVGQFSVSATLEATITLACWGLTVVYGPQGDAEKLRFLEELRNVRQLFGESWLVIGDFNMILQAQDLELEELSLYGRKFIWSNNTTQTRIDRALCNVDWDSMMPNSVLQATSSVVSDNFPLLLVGNATGAVYRGFRFEVFWAKLQGYLDTVKEAWEKDLRVHNPFLRLHIKLQRTGKALKRWARAKIGNNMLLLCAARKLIGFLDVVQEHRSLSALEVLLRHDLKVRYLGMMAIEKMRAKQRSRLAHIKSSDAQSKLFFLHGRKRKNHIQFLNTEEGSMHTHLDKRKHIFDHFSTQFRQKHPRTHTLDWGLIGLQRLELSSLEAPFNEEEVHEVIDDLASDKAPGPDGFIGAFLKSAWHIIKTDIMLAMCFFFDQHEQHFKQLNSSHMVLVPKKRDTKRLGDYRPISLTHSIAKLFSKLLANRLASFLNQLVSRMKVLFIKRSIQDNFLFIQNLVKALHRAKHPALFMKLDIAKAFDSVKWDFLMEVMQQMGFGSKWRSWVSILLSMTSTFVLLNGARGPWFRHYTGLRQGDPLSPMLFILVMEPLKKCSTLQLLKAI
jgi:hypothetical protein